jgi:tetratricopeptide (TPR) repeat protein
MVAPRSTVESLLGLAIQHVNAARQGQARLLCEQALAAHAPHPAVHQLLAVLDLREGHVERARQHANASLALRHDHVPTLMVASDAARAAGALEEAARALERIVALAPDHADAWFQLGIVQQDRHQPMAAAAALRQVLRLRPERAEAEVNLGIVLQEAGQFDDAMQAYARAYRLREDSFGRIAHALATPNVGALWLHLDDLRSTLRRTGTSARA